VIDFYDVGNLFEKNNDDALEDSHEGEESEESGNGLL
jgi:hypothetical protein